MPSTQGRLNAFHGTSILLKKEKQNMIGCNFPPNNDGLAAGANDGAIDAFAEKRLPSVVREVIQNSLDAKKYADQPVNLHFSKQTLNKREFIGLSSIEAHLLKSRDMAAKKDLTDVMKFYEHGIVP